MMFLKNSESRNKYNLFLNRSKCTLILLFSVLSITSCFFAGCSDLEDDVSDVTTSEVTVSESDSLADEDSKVDLLNSVRDSIKEVRINDYESENGKKYVTFVVFVENSDDYENNPVEAVTSLYEVCRSEYDLDNYPLVSEYDGTKPYISYIAIYNFVGRPVADYWFERDPDDSYSLPSNQLRLLDPDSIPTEKIDLKLR